MDKLPQGLAYRSGTGTLRRIANAPVYVGRALQWADVQIEAGEKITATLQITLTSRAERGA